VFTFSVHFLLREIKVESAKYRHGGELAVISCY